MRIRTTLFALSLLFLAACHNVGTTTLFKGHVTDKDSGLPLAGVSVAVLPINLASETNENGDYSMSLPRTDMTVSLLFSYPGYDSYQTEEMPLSPKNVNEYTINAVLLSRIAKAVLSTQTVDLGAEKTSLEVQLSNPGTDTLRWSFMDMNIPTWLKVEPMQGTLPMKQTQNITFTGDRSGLSLGKVQAVVQLLGGEAPLDVTVTMSKEAAVLETKGNVFDFGEEGESGTTTLYNRGNIPLTWTLAEPTPAWLTWSAVQGTVLAEDSASVTISVDRSSLDYGTHTYTTNLTSSGGEAAYSFSLTKTQDLIAVSPSGLDFGTEGTQQQISLSRTSGIHPVAFSASTSDPLLSLSPASGTVPRQGDPQRIQVTLDRSRLEPGKYTSKVLVATAEQSFEVSVSYAAEVPVDPPVVTTLESAFDSKSGSLTFLGKLESNGGGSVSQHGHCWGTEATPTLETGTHSSLGQISEGASFTSYFEGQPETGKTYYYRAYATNEAATSYGDIRSFSFSPATLAKPTLTQSDASLLCRSSVSGFGEQALTSHGCCWSLEHNPDISKDAFTDLGSRSYEGSFSVRFNDMVRGKTYYVRAFAQNASGLVYSEESSITLKIEEPVLVTNETAENVTYYTATVGGYFETMGSEPLIRFGHCLSTHNKPTVDDIVVESTSEYSSYTSELTGLLINTTYYFRAFAQTANGVYYGDIYSFTTENDPSVVQQDGLRLYITANENGNNAYDWTGHIAQLVVSNGISFNRSNKPAGTKAAISFNGNSGYLLSRTFNPLAGQNQGTINFWLRFRSTMSKSQVYPLFGSVSQGGMYVELRYEDNAWVFTLCLGPGMNTYKVPLPSFGSIDIASFLGTDWHMLSIVSDGKTSAIYLDGTSMKTMDMGLQFGVQEDFVIGANALNATTLNTFMAADLACIRMYAKTLSDSAIKTIFDAGM